MKELLTYMLETLAASGLLLGAYSVLLEGRVPFRWCCAWLLGSMALAALIPLLRIPVWAAEVVTVQPAVAAEAAAVGTAGVAEGFVLGPGQIARMLYGAGVCFMLGLLLRQWLAICRLERGAEIEERGDYRLVRTLRPVAAFSFFRTVYIPRELPAEELPAVLAHERSHIRHGHTLERMAMELLKAALWWNPFVRFASRRLTEAEEFEADAEVLDGGFGVAEYQRTIFRQQFGYCPEIANGLRDSFTKKRFKMMTSKPTSRYARLRLAAALPLVAALVVAFGFTARATVYRTLPPAGSEAAVPDSRDSMAGKAARPVDDDEPYIVADQMPTFEGGGIQDFRQWVMTQVRYPAEAQQKKIQGRVVVQFVVEKDGSMGGLTVVRTPDRLLSEEVVRVLQKAPKWTPGREKGKLVRVKYALPVDFSLPDGSDSGSASPAPDANTVDKVTVVGFGA